MKIEIAFKDDEARSLQWILRLRYNSKAKLKVLAKQAIRDIAAQYASEHLIITSQACKNVETTTLHQTLNIGLRHERIATNNLERKFAEEWECKNTTSGYGILDYLLADELNRPRGEVSKRDRQVAATIIQWLGTLVGQDFIDTVVEGTEY